jgi:hypothetical protein
MKRKRASRQCDSAGMLSLMHDGVEGHSFDMWIKAPQYPT